MINETETTYTETMDFNEFLERAKTNVPKERQFNAQTVTGRYSLDFEGCYSYKEAIGLAENGWPEGAQLVAQKSKKFIDQISTKVERMEFDYNVEGTMFDVGMVAEGIPECWIEPRYTKVQDSASHLVKIMVNRGALRNRSTKDIRNRGICIASFIEILELAGKSVELWICFPANTSYGQQQKTTLMVKVKEYDQRLDMDKIAFTLVHPAAHRVFKFRWIELLPQKFYSNLSGNYGRTSDLDSDIAKEYDIYFSSIEAYTYGSDMEKWIEEQLLKAGVTFKD